MLGIYKHVFFKGRFSMFFQMSIFWFTRVEVELEAHITPGGSTHVGYSTTKYELLTPSGSGRTRHRFFLPSDL